MLVFFEGSEKKVEILVHHEQLSLLNDLNDDFWSELVNRCHAKILSSIRNEHCISVKLQVIRIRIFDYRTNTTLLASGSGRTAHTCSACSRERVTAFLCICCDHRCVRGWCCHSGSAGAEPGVAARLRDGGQHTDHARA